MDVNLGSAHQAFARSTFDDADQFLPTDFPQFPRDFVSRNQFLTVEDTWIVSPRTLHTFRGSFARTRIGRFVRANVPSTLALFVPGRGIMGGIARPLPSSPTPPGNIGRGAFLGPNLRTLDLAASKATRLPWGENLLLQFRAEAFNILNRANFGVPALLAFAGITDNERPLGSLGQIRATVTSSRQIQLGLKLTF